MNSLLFPIAVKWNKDVNAFCCCGCGKRFKPDDLVYPQAMTGAVTVHYRRECAEQYNDDSLNVEKGK